jgi:hypothetical protein
VDLVTALHMAARRYCLEQAAHWREISWQRDRAPILDRRHPEREIEEKRQAAVVTAARISGLEAILEEVERFVPGDFDSEEEARALLMLADQSLASWLSQSRKPVQPPAEVEERRLYREYIESLRPADLVNIAPLPYRRRLSRSEADALWKVISSRWDIRDHYWHPLAPHDPPQDVIAFQADWFDLVLPPARIQTVLGGHGISRIWEFREDGRDSEIDLGWMEPCYTGLEGFWTAEPYDWLIYASHESSLTIAGQWLIDAVKAASADWEQRLYSGWDYERPPRG